MGSAISPFYANYFLDHFETSLFNSDNHLITCVHTWLRYVDDVFCIWTGTERQLTQFLTTLNNINNKIQFTIEIGDRNLNFLDLKITINNNCKFEFDIYRKDTYTDSIIPIESNHPLNTKLAAFHSMLNRLINIPMNKKNFKKELETIRTIAKNNGYSIDLVDKLLSKKLKNIVISKLYPTDKTKPVVNTWRRIPYVGPISDNLGKILRSFNVAPAYFNNRTIGKTLLNNKIIDKRDPITCSGVYQITCSDCPAIYVGKSKREVKKRFSEHVSYAKYNKHASGLASHLINNNHTCNINNLKLLHRLEGGPILDRYEVIEIKRAISENKIVTNDQLDFGNNPLLDPDIVKL